MALIDPPFATPDDVAGVWRPLRGGENTLVLNLLRDASAMILEYPGVVARIAAGTLGAETLRSVAKSMVRRVMTNPDGLRQFSATVDDATKSGTYDSTMASGQLYINASELNRLLGVLPPNNQAGAFTITPGGQADSDGDSFAELARIDLEQSWAGLGSSWT